METHTKSTHPITDLPWDATLIRQFRRHVGLTQAQLSGVLGTRQQTISEWETGLYTPTGCSARLLTLLAMQAGFQSETGERAS